MEKNQINYHLIWEVPHMPKQLQQNCTIHHFGELIDISHAYLLNAVDLHAHRAASVYFVAPLQ